MISPVSAVADRYVLALAAHDPAAAQACGIASTGALPDLSPSWFAERHELEGRLIDELESAQATDRLDVILKAALAERLASNRAMFATGYTTRMLAGLGTPLHELQGSVEGIVVTADAAGDAQLDRLEAIPTAVAQYTETLRWSRDNADGFTGSGVAAARQVRVIAAQVERWVDTGYFRSLPVAHDTGPDRRSRAISAGIGAEAAFAELARFLTEELLPAAPAEDSVGEETYRVLAEGMLGVELDLDEVYSFGWSELRRLVAEARALATTLGGTGPDPVRSVSAALDADPRYLLEGIDAIRSWLSGRVEETIRTLGATAFDLPDGIRSVDCIVSEASAGVVHYTPGTPDGSANSRIVWTIPSGVARAASWQEVTSVHHEGLPGHHLEYSVNRANPDLHPFQRYLCHVHGYAEGWAHYAETLSDELGLIRDPAERLGMVLGQIWRSVRIVADIGLHTGRAIPPHELTDATCWTPAVGRQLLEEFALVEPALASFEVDRYLGVPGQALAFRVGAKLWLDARAAWRQRRGDAFSLAGFHREALGYGPMGLGPLRRLLLDEPTAQASTAVNASS